MPSDCQCSACACHCKTTSLSENLECEKIKIILKDLEKDLENIKKDKGKK